MYGPRGSIVSNDIPWVQQTPGGPENLAMDKEITFAKKNGITISNTAAVLLLFVFFGCIAGTGFLVYFLVPCPETATASHQQKDAASVEATTYYETRSVDHTVEATTQPAIAPAEKVTDVRLPRSVHPQKYDLKIVPFLDAGNFTFRGEVVIVVNVTEATSNITLHANDLDIDESMVKVLANDNSSVDVLRFETNKQSQFFILHFSNNLLVGEHTIFISYVGVLTDALQGFYRSSYKKGNETRWLAATQFQPTDARRAFPCFDEPALKAQFKISIGRPSKMTAISNMPKSSSEPMENAEGYMWDHFKQSVPMSTYLVAFVVSDFKSKTKAPVSLWAREDAIDQTMYSLEIAPQVLKYYEQFFNISFPLPKIDMIALPDFSAGAMENWGLITYRESNLLYEDGVSSRRNKQSVAIVIAHELAHQWFGNLVTPSWWTDLWLNEGFASYLEYVGVDAVNPDWKMLDQFVIYELQLVFALDALKSSHQISIQVNNPDEINDIFDKISYAKGATIIRMMEHFMTTKVFKSGLTNYLTEKKYGHAQQDDLWKFLTDEGHSEGVLDASMSVKEIMETWTLQTGFPVVNVVRSYEDNSVVLKQERFLLNKSESDHAGSNWWIPVTFTDANEKLGSVWMTGVPTKRFNVNTSSADWLLFNVNQTGYYRVNYDENNWKMITAQLRKKGGYTSFDPKNRAQIVDDSLNLANAGYLNYTIALDITRYLEQEKEFVPWKAALKGLDYIYEMFLRSGHFDKYKNYLLSIITPFYFEVGYRDYSTDPLLMTYNRFEILSRACRLGHLDCISNAVRLFQNWKAAPDPDKHNPISPNLKGIVYCTALRGGGEEEWQFAWQRYLKANVGTERDLLLAALACTRESWLLNKYLDMAMTEGSGIRKQDSPTVFSAVARNIVGQPLAFKYLTSNWNKIRKYLGSNRMSLNIIIHSVTMNFNSEYELEDLKQFASQRSKELGVNTRAINQAIEQTTANIDWMQMNFDTILSWLENHS